MSSKYVLFLTLLCLVVVGSSCKKYLSEKPNKSLNTPSTLADLQLLLDNYGNMNASFPSSAEVLADNYYLAQPDWNSITNTSLRNYYIWQKDDQYSGEWGSAYRVVFTANVVLDELSRLDYAPDQQATANALRGAALFYRAFAFYALAQLFAPPYDSTTAAALPGIPLRLDAGIEKRSERATVQQTWQQVLDDLKGAARLLPPTAAAPNRPSRTAAYAALARTYLAMGQYSKALLYAEDALQAYATLLDYNTLSLSAANPIARFNAEVLFPAVSLGAQPLNPSRAKVDSTLYAAYHANDLRKAIFFRSSGAGTFAPKGNYDGSATGAVFTGLTTSELYLVKAETLARLGHTAPAMDALNTLLVRRWKQGTFVPLTAATAPEALDKILAERRKELVWRGQRWTDLRRLNKEPGRELTLVRRLGNDTYTLPPNSNGYTLLIPATVIDLSGMPQNP